MLSASYAHVLLASGKLAGVEGRLWDAERWSDPAAEQRARPHPADEMVVVDHAAFSRLPGEIAVARAGLALAHGDMPATMTYAQHVLDLVPEDDHFMRGAAAAFLGLAAWTSGQLETADPHQKHL